MVDTAVKVLDSEIDGGNSDEQANKCGDDPYYFHPVGHNEGCVSLGAETSPLYMEKCHPWLLVRSATFFRLHLVPNSLPLRATT